MMKRTMMVGVAAAMAVAMVGAFAALYGQDTKDDAAQKAVANARAKLLGTIPPASRERSRPRPMSRAITCTRPPPRR